MTSSEKAELQREIAIGLADLEHRKQRMNELLEKINKLGYLRSQMQDGRGKLKKRLDDLQEIFVKYGMIRMLNDIKEQEKTNLKEQNDVLNDRIDKLTRDIDSMKVLPEKEVSDKQVRRDKDILRPEKSSDPVFQKLREGQ